MSRHFCYFCGYYTEYLTDWTCSADEFKDKVDAIANHGKDCTYFKEGDWKHRRSLISEYTFSNGQKLSVIRTPVRSYESTLITRKQNE